MPDIPWESPSANALLIAERVFRDRDTGEWIIAGVFNQLHVRQLPQRHPRLDVFFQITNVSRPVDLRLRVEHAEGDVLLDFGGPIKANSPLYVHEQKVTLDGLVFHKQGKHWIQLLSNEEILTQAPLHVILHEEGADHGGAGSQHAQ